MTVEDLIKELSELPRQAEVVFARYQVDAQPGDFRGGIGEWPGIPDEIPSDIITGHEGGRI